MTDLVTRLRALAKSHSAADYVENIDPTRDALREAADDIQRLREKCDRSIGQTEKLIAEKSRWLQERDALKARVEALDRISLDTMRDRDDLKANLTETERLLEHRAKSNAQLAREWDKERDDLKAKLAVSEKYSAAMEQAFTIARADAAALREVAKDTSAFFSWLAGHGSYDWNADPQYATLKISKLTEALSQPGPGAALLERLESETTRADLAEQSADKLVEKNDALLERVKKLEAVLNDLATGAVIESDRRIALAALAE